MAELLKSKYEGKLEGVHLVPSSGGAFEVSIDGDLIYSKLRTGRFPEEEEITTAVDKALQKRELRKK